MCNLFFKLYNLFYANAFRQIPKMLDKDALSFMEFIVFFLTNFRDCWLFGSNVQHFYQGYIEHRDGQLLKSALFIRPTVGLPTTGVQQVDSLSKYAFVHFAFVTRHPLTSQYSSSGVIES